jgi:hypothetical protein
MSEHVATCMLKNGASRALRRWISIYNFMNVKFSRFAPKN